MDRPPPVRGQVRLRTGGLYLGVAALVFIVDRITKAMVDSTMVEGQVIPIIDRYVYLNYIRNTGSAFSLRFLDSNGYILVALVIGVGLTVYVLAAARLAPSLVVVAGMVLGGTAGNAVDRLLHGGVTDFMAIGIWPRFNVADSAISVAVLALVLRSLVRRPTSS